MSDLVHARVVEHLQRLRLQHLADRLDAVLAEITEQTDTDLDDLAAALAELRAERLAAQDDIAEAGTGGNATASANGGAVVIGNVDSGGNVGNVISVGNTGGPVWVDGGDVSSSTTIGVTANGGTAIADASGGSGNVAAATGDGRGWVACNCNACSPREYCCNWSCGFCARHADTCSQRACNFCHAV